MNFSSSAEDAVLSILSESEKPVGSPQIQGKLTEAGISISEPTVGRILRVLDRKGFTLRVGNVGRSITKSGRRRITELEQEETRREQALAVVGSLRPSNVAEIRDVLVARRAVERETARQAAIRATGADIRRLEEFVASQHPDAPHTGFHNLVADAAGNPVLRNVLAFMTADDFLREKLRAILRAEGVLFDPRFMRDIIASIRRRDPDAAERAMSDHFDRITDAVDRHNGTLIT